MSALDSGAAHPQKDFPIINQPGPGPDKRIRIVPIINLARAQRKKSSGTAPESTMFLIFYQLGPCARKNPLALKFFAETPCIWQVAYMEDVGEQRSRAQATSASFEIVSLSNI